MANIGDALPPPPHDHFSPDTHPALYEKYLQRSRALDCWIHHTRGIIDAMNDGKLGPEARFSATFTALYGLCLVVRSPNLGGPVRLAYYREQIDGAARRPHGEELRLPPGSSLLLDGVDVSASADDRDKMPYTVHSQPTADGVVYEVPMLSLTNSVPWVYLDRDPRED